ncbi:MAG: Transaldolase, partial [uncultured Ramlibacter sp.]
ESTRSAQAVHRRGGGHGRFPPAGPVPAAGRHHQSVADPQGRAEARVRALAPGDDGPLPRQAAGRDHGPAAGAVRPRDPVDHPRAGLDRSGCATELRYGSHHRPGRADHPALPRRGPARGARADQDCGHLGRHPGGRAARATRDPHQPDAAVLLRPGGCLRQGQGAPDLPLCGADLRLVQEGGGHCLGRGRAIGPERPRGEVRAPDLPVLQELRHPDGGDGGELPQHRPDPGPGRLRLAD